MAYEWIGKDQNGFIKILEEAVELPVRNDGGLERTITAGEMSDGHEGIT